MFDQVLCMVIGGGAALGAGLAQLRGPTCWSWEGRVGDLNTRLSRLR